MKKLILAGLLMSSLSGCSSNDSLFESVHGATAGPLLEVIFGPLPTSRNYVTMTGGFVGEKAENLAKYWGYPDNLFKSPINGNNIYVYNTILRSGAVAGYYCITYFEVNNLYRVVGWSSNGNSCVF